MSRTYTITFKDLEVLSRQPITVEAEDFTVKNGCYIFINYNESDDKWDYVHAVQLSDVISVTS